MLAVVLINGEAGGAQSGRPLVLLDVPFISQSEALCGGAAAAMVLRYWGARGLDAESFAHLVDRSAAGIRTTALIGDLHARGWNATAIAGTNDLIARELAGGRPILALIEDRPGTFHYIVVIGATAHAVVYHDPARTAFRTMSRDAFDRRWSRTDHWMAIVLPASAPATPVAAPVVERVEASCDGLIAGGISAAEARDLDLAERRLTSALSCGGSAPLRELAGLRLLQRRWGEVSDLAAAALAADPADAHAWRLLATSRFVQDDRRGALDAWNRVNEPRVDLIRVDGLTRTRQRVVERLLPIGPNDVLTSPGLVRARRQLRDLPSAASAQLTFEPVPTGLAELHATVAERPLVPDDRWTLASLGVVAVFRREVEVSSGALTGGGERVTAGWRYWPGRPRLSASVTSPAPWGGIWALDGFTEEQPFTDGLLPTSRRRGAHLALAGWTSAWTRISVRGGVEHWDGDDTYGMLAAGVRLLDSSERFDGRVDVSGWKGANAFGTIDLRGTMRSKAARLGRVFLARAGAGFATPFTPADLWFAGDTGRARPAPLRAHPVIAAGELRAEQIGRRIAYASGEVQQWRSGTPRIRLGAAAFVDAARVDRRLFSAARTDVDLGIGARIAVPGVSGELRIDVSKGLRDGATALSFVYDP